jgi:hypothetical protein
MELIAMIICSWNVRKILSSFQLSSLSKLIDGFMLSENKHDNTKLDHLIMPKLSLDKVKLLDENQYLRYQFSALIFVINTKGIQ